MSPGCAVFRRLAAFLALIPLKCAATTAAPVPIPLRFEQAPQRNAPLPFFALSGAGTVALAAGRVVASGVEMRVLGASPRATLAGEGTAPGRSHFLLGNDPTAWRTGRSAYTRLRAAGLLPGIDVVYRGQDGRLEYDFIVSPGANPRRIAMRFTGHSGLRIDPAGDLVLRTLDGEVRHRRPVAYQEFQGRRVEVPARFAVHQPGVVGFAVGPYDRSQPLVIDPVLFVREAGSVVGDFRAAPGLAKVATDRSGAIYLVGTTAGGIPTTPGALRDRLQGECSYSVGGGSCAISFLGCTRTYTCPDGFVMKFTADGQVEYATYLGGFQTDRAYGIAVDAEGSAYVVGSTESATFPVTAGSAGAVGGAFLLKLNRTGTAISYALRFGSGQTVARDVALDSAGNAYVAGSSTAESFPSTSQVANRALPDQLSAFVLKVSPAGDRFLYGLLVGGPTRPDVTFYHNTGRAIAVDSLGNAHLGGVTKSNAFPVSAGLRASVAPGDEDAFVAKVNAAGTALSYATLLGGTRLDGLASLAVDAAGSVYVVGATESRDFPVTPGAYRATPAGAMVGSQAYVAPSSGYLARLSSGGEILAATYLDLIVPGGVALDSQGRPVLAGGSPWQPQLGPVAPLCRQDPKVAVFAPTGLSLVSSEVVPFAGALALDATGAAVLAVADWNVTGGPIRLGKVRLQDSLIAPPDCAYYTTYVERTVTVDSRFAQGVAPGSLLSLYGIGLGPTAGIVARPDGEGYWPTNLEGTRVLVEGEPAPILYAGQNQVNFALPFSVAGRERVRVRVEAQGSASNEFDLTVAPVDPAFFRVGGSPPSPAVFTQEGRLAVERPIRRGEYLTLWMTGLGATDPRLEDGKVVGFPLPSLLATVQVAFFGNPQDRVPAEVTYAGPAPGQVAGVYQVNVRVPTDLRPHSSGDVTMSVTVGGRVTYAYLRAE